MWGPSNHPSPGPSKQVTLHDTLALTRRMGWAPVRLPPLCKAPIDTQWPKTSYTDAMFAPDDNIGIKLGAPSGGLVDIDLDCPEAVALAPSFLPTTWTFGRNGPGKTTGTMVHWDDVDARRHWLYRCQNISTIKPSRTHVELRSTGAQTVFPGSIHSGEQIEWVDTHGDIPTLAPDALTTAFAKLCFATCLARVWPSVIGDRHHLLLSLSGALWHQGWTAEDAAQVILTATSLDGTEDAHRAGTIASTWEPIEKDRLGWPSVERILGAPDTQTLQRHADLVPTVRRGQALSMTQDLHDVGNAERLLSQYGSELVHIKGMGWLQWDGTRWTPSEPAPLAIRAARQLLADASAAGDVPSQKWAFQSLSNGRLQSCIALAEQIDQRVHIEMLDSDSWLLGCHNGVIDLRQGRLVSHDRSQWLTRQSPVTFDPSETCPRFVQFLHEIFESDIERIQYVVRYLGYCLTADVREQCISVWYGHGANGKSTLIDLVLSIMGDYAQKMSGDLLTASKTRSSSGPSPDVARLRGVRLAAGSEVAEGNRWDEPLVKTLTGGDRIVARHLHQEPIEFDPTWKLILAVNHKPPVRGTDDGIWRRIHLLPFTRQFQHGTQDRELPAKLQSEHAGILALLVQGCLAWQRDGLALPRSMVAATSEYRVEHDTIGSFLAEATRQKYGAASNKSAMYRTYRAWAAEAGEHVFGRSIFVRMLRERRIEENGTQWLDIEIMAGF